MPAGELPRALEPGGSGRRPARPRCAGFDVAVITVPTPLREGLPDLSYIEAAGRTLARYLRPGATVSLESTTYPGTTRSWSRRCSRTAPGWPRAPTSTSATAPSGSTRATATWTLEPRRRWYPASTRLAGRGAGVLRGIVDPDRAGVRAARGRAGQAAREHLPARQHRTGQRAGDVRAASSASTSGRRSTPRPPSRSAT